MLEASQEIVKEIAQMPTKHSWAQPLMMLDSEVADEAEEMVIEWIEEEMERTIPDVSYMAVRLVRTVWLHLLEREAIEAYQAANPSPWGHITIVWDVEDAVAVAAADHPYRLPEKDLEDAKKFLEKMEKGEAKPDVEHILSCF